MAKVIALQAFKRAKTISCYLSMPTAEVQTTALISNILADNGTGVFLSCICNALGYSQRQEKNCLFRELHPAKGGRWIS